MIQVNVGTLSADEGLAAYADSPFFTLPKRWFGAAELISVRADSTGIAIKYPALRRGEVCHAQIVVAWKKRQDAEDDDTDFAVDLSPLQIASAAYPDQFLKSRS
ncbi:hypothetical protein SU48_02825 [Deinococcus puniceus]|uniref:Uncharacterized protein n=1 Tax=Deinococcus puniceus TaxID=1182568 RepID=A0A172T7F3_9DEIO|nr:hypothetical protein SU48_02825 [Deinococcus puniceus]